MHFWDSFSRYIKNRNRNQMDTLVGILVFIILLFLYLHITTQFKTSEDLEIYEFDYTTNQALQEICDMKQPVLFSLENIVNEQNNYGEKTIFNDIQINKLTSLDPAIDESDVLVKDVNDYQRENETVESAILTYRSANLLISSDTKSKYISENNQEFIADSDLDSIYGNINMYLRPPLCVQTRYDLLFGSKLASTPLRYHNNQRTFYAVTSGKIRVKMTPWKSHRFIPYMKDYDSGEFVSPVYIWGSKCNDDNKEGLEEYNLERKWKSVVDKLKFIEFEVYAGYVLFVPAYWWYSIQYSGDDSTTVCEMTYNGLMNRIAHIKDISLFFMQQMNITKKHGGRKTFSSSEQLDTCNPISPNLENNARSSDKKLEDGTHFTESKPEKVDYVEKTHNEIVTNTGIYKLG